MARPQKKRPQKKRPQKKRAKKPPTREERLIAVLKQLLRDLFEEQDHVAIVRDPVYLNDVRSLRIHNVKGYDGLIIGRETTSVEEEENFDEFLKNNVVLDEIAHLFCAEVPE